MKKIYQFSVNKEETKIEIEESKNEKGETVKIEKPTTIQVPVSFFIRKPNRSLIDDAELFHAVNVANGIKAGLLTSSQLYKRFLDDGGILSKPEKEKLEKFRQDSNKLQIEFQLLAQKERNKEQEERAIAILNELGDIRNELQKFELQQESLFSQTAENIARNKTILWYILNLSYKINPDNSESLFFGEGTFEDKIKKYDELDESDDNFTKLVIKKLFFLVSFWYTGRAVTEEDFKNIDNISNDLDD